MPAAIAFAVTGWSPVIMTVESPARCSAATVEAACGRGVSARATKPSRVRSSVNSCGPGAGAAGSTPASTSLTLRRATASTRSPSPASSATVCPARSRPARAGGLLRAGHRGQHIPPAEPGGVEPHHGTCGDHVHARPQHPVQRSERLLDGACDHRGVVAEHAPHPDPCPALCTPDAALPVLTERLRIPAGNSSRSPEGDPAHRPGEPHSRRRRAPDHRRVPAPARTEQGRRP
jgi:hypothetical protein